MIRVQKLYKSFGDQPVLRGVDLDVATGEIMVIIGRSGGGKSVLLKHLIGLLRPDAGAILLDGVDITRMRGRALDADPADATASSFRAGPSSTRCR